MSAVVQFTLDANLSNQVGSLIKSLSESDLPLPTVIPTAENQALPRAKNLIKQQGPKTGRCNGGQGGGEVFCIKKSGVIL